MYEIIVAKLKNEGTINFTLENIERKFKGFPDIKKIIKAFVSGEYKFIKNLLNLNLNIKCNIEMLCSYTLKEVIVPIEFDLDLTFGSGNESDYPLLDKIELSEIIIGNIIAEAPYNIYAEDINNFKKD